MTLSHVPPLVMLQCIFIPTIAVLLSTSHRSFSQINFAQFCVLLKEKEMLFSSGPFPSVSIHNSYVWQ